MVLMISLPSAGISVLLTCWVYRSVGKEMKESERTVKERQDTARER